MSRKMIVEIVCDVCASTDGSSEMRFAVGARGYAIDLCKADRERLEEALEPFIAKARPAGSRPAVTGGSPHVLITARPPRRNPALVREIREWATANGFDISARGRIPRHVDEAFQASKQHR